MAAQPLISEWARVQLPEVPTGHTHSTSLAPQPLLRDMILPDEVLFGAMPDPRLRFKRPLRVQIERTDHGATAQAEDIGEFGYGAGSGDALYDLGKTIAELYFSLNADKERLSPDLEWLRSRLDEYIELRRLPEPADQR